LVTGGMGFARRCRVFLIALFLNEKFGMDAAIW